MVFPVLLGQKAKEELLSIAANYGRPAAFVFLWVSSVFFFNFIFFEKPVFVKSNGREYSPINLLYVLILGPIAEEMFYRGFVWSALDKAFEQSGKKIKDLTCFTLSSVIFGIYHLGFWEWKINQASLFHVASALAGGLIFGAIRLKSGEIGWSILIHQWMNSLALIVRAIFEN